jgi:FKBP-type peptidyl-prolyl cis-trans isomerase SlyD
LVEVAAVKDDEVVVDRKYLLAGMALNFFIRIITVRNASEEELAHGHVHGTGENEQYQIIL